MSKRFSLHDMNMLLQRRKSSLTSLIMSDYVILVANGARRECIKQIFKFKFDNQYSSLRSSPDTVQCDRCKKYFHMACVQPPLIAKPSRGYGWTCAPCSRRHEEEVDSHEVRHPTPSGRPKSNAPAARGRGRPRKDRGQAEREEISDIKHFKMWPFRYFG